MVRKIIIVIMILAAISSMTIAASAESLTTEYNQIAFQVAQSLLSDMSFLDDYFFCNVYENIYILAIGDFKVENNYIKNNGNYTEYVITVIDNNYSVEKRQLSNLNVNIEEFYIYSNFNNFPSLIERGSRYEEATTVLLVISLCIYIIRSIYCFTLRLRR